MAKRAAIRGRRSKFNAKPTVVDGIRFHSQREAKRYSELKLLEKAGEIRGLVLQPRYGLFAGGPSKRTCLGDYVADFRYTYTQGGPTVVEDVKGFKTPLYRWKKKHVEAQYDIQITEV